MCTPEKRFGRGIVCDFLYSSDLKSVSKVRKLTSFLPECLSTQLKNYLCTLRRGYT